MLDKAEEALTKGLSLRPKDKALLIRTGWVLIVSVHILWVCGWLAFAGFASPFARAADVEKLQRASKISAQIQIQAEIREQGRIFCASTDERTRDYVERRIDELRANLREIADIDEPRPVCR